MIYVREVLRMFLSESKVFIISFLVSTRFSVNGIIIIVYDCIIQSIALSQCLITILNFVGDRALEELKRAKDQSEIGTTKSEASKYFTQFMKDRVEVIFLFVYVLLKLVSYLKIYITET